MMKLTMLGLNCRPLAVTNTLDCHLRKPHFPRSSLLHICSNKGLFDSRRAGWSGSMEAKQSVMFSCVPTKSESTSNPPSKHIQWKGAAKEPVQKSICQEQSSGATRSGPGPSFARKYQNSLAILAILAIASFPQMTGCRPGWLRDARISVAGTGAAAAVSSRPKNYFLRRGRGSTLSDSTRPVRLEWEDMLQYKGTEKYKN